METDIGAITSFSLKGKIDYLPSTCDESHELIPIKIHATVNTRFQIQPIDMPKSVFSKFIIE